MMSQWNNTAFGKKRGSLVRTEVFGLAPNSVARDPPVTLASVKEMCYVTSRIGNNLAYCTSLMREQFAICRSALVPL